MKKSVIIILSIVLILGALTSSLYFRDRGVRKSAWNQLNPESKALIKGTWKEGKVTKVTLKDSMGTIIDKAYIGKKVYLVDFPTRGGSIPGYIGVFVTPEDNKVVGYGYSD